MRTNILLNNTFQAKLLRSHKDLYHEIVDHYRDDSEDSESPPEISKEFIKSLKSIFKSEKLDSYHPLHFYWLSLVNKLVDLMEIIDTNDEGLHLEFWKTTDLDDKFKEFHQKGSPLDASKKTLRFLEDKILKFSSKHIVEDEQSLMFQSKELGDFDQFEYYPKPRHFLRRQGEVKPHS